MKRLRLAVVGLGGLGRACARLVRDSDGLELAGVVRRRERLAEKLPRELCGARVASHWRELGAVDAALLCVPADRMAGTAHDVMQQGLAIVECAERHGEDFARHRAELTRMANRFGVTALIGAGWDPGLLSVWRGQFKVLIPSGKSELTRRPGVSLHHTVTARDIPGVSAALSTELRAAGRRQHYVYVELEQGVSVDAVAAAIRSDPLFLDEETFVFPVESVAALEAQGHGALLERYGTVGGDHQRFLLEGRFDAALAAARVMVAASGALAWCGKGGFTLFDLPPGWLLPLAGRDPAGLV